MRSYEIILLFCFLCEFHSKNLLPIMDIVELLFKRIDNKDANKREKKSCTFKVLPRGLGRSAIENVRVLISLSTK